MEAWTTMRTAFILFLILLLPLCAQNRAPFYGRTTTGISKRAFNGVTVAGQDLTDNFDRANNADLGANWTTITSEGSLGVSGNACTFNVVSADSAEYYSGVSWTANQSSEVKVTISGTSPGEGGGVAVRASSSIREFYGVVINSDGEWELFKRIAGAKTAIVSATTTYSAGAVMKIAAIGTTITVTYNSVVLTNATETQITSGSPGICYSSQPNSWTCDDWRGIDGL